MNEIFAKVLILVLFAGFAACDDEEVAADAAGDAFIVSKLTGVGLEADTVYGLALHAFGNKSFSTVTAKAPDNTSFTLESYNGYTYDFYYETEEDEFLATLPDEGNYTFACSFTTAESVSATDQLSDDVLYPVNITKAVYDDTDSRIELEWTSEEDDVDYYVIFMENDDDEIVYVSQALAGTVDEFNISSGTYTWVNGESPENGKTYKVSINAYMYEAAAGADLNIQAKSIATASVVWNPAD